MPQYQINFSAPVTYGDFPPTSVVYAPAATVSGALEFAAKYLSSGVVQVVSEFGASGTYTQVWPVT